MADNGFDVKFRTSYDGSGANQAQNDIRATANAANQSMDDLAAKTRIAGEEATRSNSSWRATTLIWKGFFGLVSGRGVGALSALRTGFKLLWVTLASNPLGALLSIVTNLAVFGIPALVRWLFKSSAAAKEAGEAAEEARKKHEELLASLKKEADEKLFKGQVEGLKELKTAYDEARAAAEALFARQREEADIELATKTAELELEEAQAMEDAADDPVKQAELRRDFNRRKLSLKQEHEKAKNQAEMAHEQEKIDAAEKQKAAQQAPVDEADFAVKSSQNELNHIKKRVAESRESLTEQGIQSEEDKQLMERRYLVQERTSDPEKFAANRKKSARLADLDARREELEEKASTAPTYGEDEKEKMKELRETMEANKLAVERLERERNLVHAQRKPFQKSRELSGAQKALEASYGASFLENIDTKYKGAEEAHEKAKGNQNKVQGDASAETKRQEKIIADAEAKKGTLQKRIGQIEAQQSQETFKTAKQDDEALREANQKKAVSALQVQIKNEESGLKKMAEGSEEWVAAMHHLARQREQLLREQAGPEERLSEEGAANLEADIQKVGQDTEEKLKAVLEAQRKKAQAEEERRKKEFEKNGGPELEAAVREEVARVLAQIPSPKFGREKAVVETGKALEKDPLNRELLEKFTEQTKDFTKGQGMVSTQQLNLNNSFIGGLNALTSRVQDFSKVSAKLEDQQNQLDAATDRIKRLEDQGRNGGFGKR